MVAYKLLNIHPTPNKILDFLFTITSSLSLYCQIDINILISIVWQFCKMWHWQGTWWNVYSWGIICILVNIMIGAGSVVFW